MTLLLILSKLLPACKSDIQAHQIALKACRLCPQMQAPPIVGQAVASPVMLVGQAPGDKEPKLQKPFAWTAGKTLFRWFEQSCGMNEQQLRERIYISAVCRCFPGKKASGGDRVPNRTEISNCSRWLTAEINLLQPDLVIPVGKLAIEQFMTYSKLADHIGQQFRCCYAELEFDVIPLPHPSGASPWPRIQPGQTLLQQALNLIANHPIIQALCLQNPST